MARRHQTKLDDWRLLISRLQELVLANSGEDEFQEIFKIIIAKLYSERFSGRAPAFGVQRSPTKTANSINQLLIGANSQWPGIVNGRPRARLTSEHLEICVEAIQSYSISDTSIEVLDQFFEYLVGRVVKGEKGQYFTPRQVIECCIKIMDPLPSETVLDPACGSGGFLVHTFNHNIGRLNEPPQQYSSRNLWGCDFDSRAVQIAKALMLVAGDGSSNIHQLNSLRKTAYGDLLEISQDGVPRITIEDLMRSKVRNFKGFDLIFTNPPFAGEIKEESLLMNYEIAKRNRIMERDALFLERCVELLRPGGRLAIVLPHNKFGGANWSYLRDWLVRRVRIVGVLGLDRNAFLPHTHQKTSVLFGVKRMKSKMSPSNEPILFAISESSGKDSSGKVKTRSAAGLGATAWDRADHDLGDVVDQFNEFVRSHEVKWRV